MKRVLIVDDEPHVLMLLKQFLERAGYQVDTAMNGEQGLSRITQQMPDIVVTDVQMPKMGGLEFCERLIKQHPYLCKLVIIMTSRTDREIRIWADGHEFAEIMEKPVSMRRLVLRLDDYFSTQAD